jgi:cell division septum initiation protein DivIVA
MSDDLKKLLRRPYGNLTGVERQQVADRIEELEAEAEGAAAIIASERAEVLALRRKLLATCQRETATIVRWEAKLAKLEAHVAELKGETDDT